MDWVQLAAPLIAVAVWILSSLQPNQQKETRQQPRTPLPPPRPRDPLDPMAAGRQTRPEDDNKYREEMDRKREKVCPQAKPIPRPRPPPQTLRSRSQAPASSGDPGKSPASSSHGRPGGTHPQGRRRGGTDRQTNSRGLEKYARTSEKARKPRHRFLAQGSSPTTCPSPNGRGDASKRAPP